MFELFQIIEHGKDWHEHNAAIEMLYVTRSGKHTVEENNPQSKLILTPAHDGTITKSKSVADRQKQMVIPIFERGRLS